MQVAGAVSQVTEARHHPVTSKRYPCLNPVECRVTLESQITFRSAIRGTWSSITR